jgi:DNA-binding FadR family transcriptional regulator
MSDLIAQPESPFQADDLIQREPRLRERLALLLAREIVSGRFPAGAAFPSTEELVTRFEVSRTVAREALQTLFMLGLVRVQHGKRTEVLPMESWDILSSVVQTALRAERRAAPIIRDTYEFRLLIEPQGAAWMSERGTSAEIAELHDLAAQMVAEAQSGDPGKVPASDRMFHSLIAVASGNVIYAAVSRDIREVISTLWELSVLKPAQTLTVALQHVAVADAIAARDAGAAASAMRAHLTWAMSADIGTTDTNAGAA